jgi:hypothetical protein
MTYREQELARSGMPFVSGDRVAFSDETLGEGLVGLVSGWERHPNLPVHFAIRLLPEGQWIFRTADRLTLVRPVVSAQQAHRELSALNKLPEE